eukprot:10579738-Ditylum_brightwellii.AAC.1
MDRGQTEGKIRKQKQYKSTFSALTAPLNVDFKRSLGQILEVGQWLNMFPCYQNNTVLGQGEFKDGLIIRFGCTHVDLLKYCGGCQKKYFFNMHWITRWED